MAWPVMVGSAGQDGTMLKDPNLSMTPPPGINITNAAHQCILVMHIKILRPMDLCEWDSCNFLSFVSFLGFVYFISFQNISSHFLEQTFLSARFFYCYFEFLSLSTELCTKNILIFQKVKMLAKWKTRSKVIPIGC